MATATGLARASVVVGREVELDQLRRAVQDARAGRATCLLVVGEGGIGKTRLLGEASSYARRSGLGVLAGRASIPSPAPFGVVAEALRSWLRGHPPPDLGPFDRGLRMVLPEWADESEPADLDAGQRRLLALEAVVRLIGQIAASSRGAVIVLDDLHAADPESLEAVRYLASASVSGVTIIGALRPGESDLADGVVRALSSGGVATVTTVAALNERAVADLVSALLDATAPAPLVDDIVARTDGVPLLVEEMFLAHARAGTIVVGEAGGVWRWGVANVPKTVRELAEARLNLVDHRQRAILVAGAVVGDFEPSLMSAVSEEDDAAISDALAAGVRVGLLEYSSGVMAFRHAIIREAVLEATVPHLVDTMHRRAAAALDRSPVGDAGQLERRAHHLVAIGAADDAALALVAAAERRLAEHALLAAEQIARAAVDLARVPATRAAAADALAGSLAAQGRC